MFSRWSAPLSAVLPYFLLLVGVSSLLLFGVIGLLRRDLPWQLDLATLYGSGWKLRQGIVPYGAPSTPAAIAAEGVEVWLYAYPPSFAPLAMGLSKLGWGGAKLASVLLNLAAAVALAIATAVMMRPDRADHLRAFSPQQIAVAGVVLASPFAGHIVWLGNTTLLVTLALLLAWWANDNERPIAAGLLLAVVAIKPQFALLPGLWLLMERRWTVIAAAAAGSLLLSAYAMIVYGPIQVFVEWIGGLLTYLDGGENQPGCLYCFGIGDLLVAGNLPSTNIEVLALLSAALLWRLRDRLTRLEILGLLMALTAFFLPAHNYDLVILAPLTGAMAVWAGQSVSRSVFALATAAVLYIPLRIVKLADSALLLRWREVVLIGLVALVVAAALQRAPEVSAADGGPNGSI